MGGSRPASLQSSLMLRFRSPLGPLGRSGPHPPYPHRGSGFVPTTPALPHATPTTPPRPAEARPTGSRLGRWRTSIHARLRTASPSGAPRTRTAPGSHGITPSAPRGRPRCGDGVRSNAAARSLPRVARFNVTNGDAPGMRGRRVRGTPLPHPAPVDAG